MRIQRLVWAGIKIEIGATTLFVDAIEGAPHWNCLEPVIPFASDTAEAHAAITHTHTDHFDPTALRRVLGAAGNVLCHKAVAEEVAGSGLRARSAELHEPVFLQWLAADIMAIPVPAADGWGDPQVSWILDGGGRRILHCGDTIWHGHWWNLARHYAPLDLVFLPINGVTYDRGRWGGSRIPATLTPEQAVTAAKLLGAKAACPIHWGMSDPGHYDEVPDAEAAFVAAAREQGVPTVALRAGDWLDWSSLGRR
jgi:L-ascorbate metabolism protein UlaG (beta-lactamase superfamily)